jgi:hypothetical protein
MGEEVRLGRGFMFWKLELQLTELGEEHVPHVLGTLARAIQVGARRCRHRCRRRRCRTQADCLPAGYCPLPASWTSPRLNSPPPPGPPDPPVRARGRAAPPARRGRDARGAALGLARRARAAGCSQGRRLPPALLRARPAAGGAGAAGGVRRARAAQLPGAPVAGARAGGVGVAALGRRDGEQGAVRGRAGGVGMGFGSASQGCGRPHLAATLQHAR